MNSIARALASAGLLLSAAAWTADAAPVNCSYDSCVKTCLKGAGLASRCSSWCSNAIRDRINACQCKKP